MPSSATRRAASSSTARRCTSSTTTARSKVRGPLNVARSPQGQPVIVQAGASDDGRQLAAETAEVVFSASDSIEGAREYYGDVKGRMARIGRAPDHLKVMPGLLVVVAPTREEAQAKFQELQDLMHPELGVALMSRRVGYDLTGYPLDGPLPPLPENKVVGSRSDMITPGRRTARRPCASSISASPAAGPYSSSARRRRSPT